MFLVHFMGQQADSTVRFLLSRLIAITPKGPCPNLYRGI